MKNRNQILGLLANSAHASDKEAAFFDFLVASPSYQLAHRQRTTGIPKNEVGDLPSDFNRVLEIYDLCGNIYEMDFEDWWEDRGRDLLRNPADVGDLLAYPVDLSMSLTELLNEFKAFIGQVKTDRATTREPKIKFITNKVRLSALHSRLALLNDKGRLERKAGKKISNWRLGVEVNLKSKWTDELKGAAKNTQDNLEARTSLGILVSKHLKEALYLAENAARGMFPLLTPIDSGLSFDYARTWELSVQQTKVSHRRRREKLKSGEPVRKTYYERKVKPMIKRQKAIEVMIQARLLLESN
jgi:hypothetical protein